MENFGPNNCFKLNKDLPTYNVTKNDFVTLDIEFKNMLRNNTDKKFFSIFYIAGHGMCKEGT